MSKTNKQTQTAFFRVSPSQGEIDSENGIVKGVKLMELGKVATFAGADGKPRSVKITEAHIDALLSHAGNRAIPVHNTHEWHDAQGKANADSVELAARIGALKSFRKDDSGDLIADAYFKAGPAREDILWSAQHNPEDTMFSVVFSYDPGDSNCIPLNFRAADIVPIGAATTALFTQTQTQNNTMTVEELVSMLADPAVKAALKSVIDGHEDATADDAPAAEMEAAAGVTDADKQNSDEKKPALMRAAIRCNRAFKRQIESSKEETAVLAEAKFTKALGTGKFTVTPPEAKDELEAKLAAYVAAGAPSRAVAILRFAKDKPAEYNEARKANKL